MSDERLKIVGCDDEKIGATEIKERLAQGVHPSTLLKEALHDYGNIIEVMRLFREATTLGLGALKSFSEWCSVDGVHDPDALDAQAFELLHETFPKMPRIKSHNTPLAKELERRARYLEPFVEGITIGRVYKIQQQKKATCLYVTAPLIQNAKELDQWLSPLMLESLRVLYGGYAFGEWELEPRDGAALLDRTGRFGQLEPSKKRSAFLARHEHLANTLEASFDVPQETWDVVKLQHQSIMMLGVYISTPYHTNVVLLEMERGT